jgi:6-pyruvoyltetrahydropterin/6-carboxytetrahydropterin synthase
MYRITKRIEFCYGHRLLDYAGKCAHPHGHNGVVEVSLVSDDLDRRGMVLDFGDVKRAVKRWIDEHLDHRMILRHDDPLVDFLREQGEPHFTMHQNPTAENLARLIYDQAVEAGLPAESVTFWETPSSWACYSP